MSKQGRTGKFIQAFALLVNIISISKERILPTYRRRTRIGIIQTTGNIDQNMTLLRKIN
jgi:hypothetical protein